MHVKAVVLMAMILVASGCGEVPKQSIELSATVGRDLKVVHNAHRQLAEILFTRIRKDINRFIDDSYAPFMIKSVMDEQNRVSQSKDPAERKSSLLLAVNKAFSQEATPELQSQVLRGMGTLVEMLRDNIEAQRKELLDPITVQEKEILDSIDYAYQQLHYANSIVTGHLASVAKVHETQEDLLEAIGLNRELPRDVAEKLAKTSDKIGSITDGARGVGVTVLDVKESIKAMRSAINDLIQRGAGKKENKL
jgi:hypothetical protein